MNNETGKLSSTSEKNCLWFKQLNSERFTPQTQKHLKHALRSILACTAKIKIIKQRYNSVSLWIVLHYDSMNLQTRNLVKFRTTCTARLSTVERHRSLEEAFLVAQFVEGTLYQLYLKSPRYEHEYLRSDNRAIDRCHSGPSRKQRKLACPKTWSMGVKLTRSIYFLIYSLSLRCASRQWISRRFNFHVRARWSLER